MSGRYLAIAIGVIVLVVVVVLGGAWFGGYFDETVEVTPPAPMAVETTPEPAESDEAAPDSGDAATQSESQAGAS